MVGLVPSKEPGGQVVQVATGTVVDTSSVVEVELHTSVVVPEVQAWKEEVKW